MIACTARARISYASGHQRDGPSHYEALILPTAEVNRISLNKINMMELKKFYDPFDQGRALEI
jgi:hypothetical protein